MSGQHPAFAWSRRLLGNTAAATHRTLSLAVSVLLLVATVGCHRAGAQPSAGSAQGDAAMSASGGGVTDIAIETSTVQTGVKRFGMNLGGQAFYDSGQLLRNLIFRNPGFEGEIWQSILHCTAVTATSCTDKYQYSAWPQDFLKGAQFEFIEGAATGAAGTVTSSTPAQPEIKDHGSTIFFPALPHAPAVGDFVVVRKTFPGGATEGWWTYGGDFSTELTDLDPASPGRQALRISTRAANKFASLSSYFDSAGPHSFLQLNGQYRVAFRAKGLGGANRVTVSVSRVTANGKMQYFSRDVDLAPHWADYSFTFSAQEKGNAVGTAALAFAASGTDLLLDDVSLTDDKPSPGNRTPFRDVVVDTLMALHPGVLRYHDDMTYGSSFDNVIAPVAARQRSGYSPRGVVADALPIGLHEFLELCQKIGAEPYYDTPPAISPAEMQALMEYLGGDASTPYGKKRADRGQVAPWTSVFPTIHLELGNEQWNYPTFPGAAIDDPVAYGKRVGVVFGAARKSPYFQPGRFDLVLGSFAALPWWTNQEATHSANFDSISVAPYLFNSFNDGSSIEAAFGPMFAQPELMDSTAGGLMHLQKQAANAVGKDMVVYEVQIGSLSGAATQPEVDAVVPSVGAGITVADHMLLMLRDLGIKTQSVWELPGYSNHFINTTNPSDQKETMPLFGTVVDMGGSTNLRRPVFLAEQLVNQAILPTMLRTSMTGANPTWRQPKSKNDDVALEKAHLLQSFAFADGQRHSLIVFNLSRTAALPVTFSGPAAPSGTVQSSQLTAKNITDNNEAQANVVIARQALASHDAKVPYSLPAYSMTVFEWTAPH